MPIPGTPAVGMRVSYDDVANPRRTGTVVAVNPSRWGTDYTVRWDEPVYETGATESRSDLAQYGWNLVPADRDPTLN